MHAFTLALLNISNYFVLLDTRWIHDVWVFCHGLQASLVILWCLALLVLAFTFGAIHVSVGSGTPRSLDVPH